MTTCDPGDVFRDPQDRLWKCHMATDRQVVLRRPGHDESKIMPRVLFEMMFRERKLMYAWNDKIVTLGAEESACIRSSSLRSTTAR